jgi:hypothetical protein
LNKKIAPQKQTKYDRRSQAFAEQEDSIVLFIFNKLLRAALTPSNVSLRYS